MSFKLFTSTIWKDIEIQAEKKQKYNLKRNSYKNLQIIFSTAQVKHDGMCHLNVCFVVVVWACELSFLAHSLSKQHNLQNQLMKLTIEIYWDVWVEILPVQRGRRSFPSFWSLVHWSGRPCRRVGHVTTAYPAPRSYPERIKLWFSLEGKGCRAVQSKRNLFLLLDTIFMGKVISDQKSKRLNFEMKWDKWNRWKLLWNISRGKR